MLVCSIYALIPSGHNDCGLHEMLFIHSVRETRFVLAPIMALPALASPHYKGIKIS